MNQLSPEVSAEIRELLQLAVIRTIEQFNAVQNLQMRLEGELIAGSPAFNNIEQHTARTVVELATGWPGRSFVYVLEQATTERLVGMLELPPLELRDSEQPDKRATQLAAALLAVWEEVRRTAYSLEARPFEAIKTIIHDALEGANEPTN